MVSHIEHIHIYIYIYKEEKEKKKEKENLAELHKRKKLLQWGRTRREHTNHSSKMNSTNWSAPNGWIVIAQW